MWNCRLFAEDLAKFLPCVVVYFPRHEKVNFFFSEAYNEYWYTEHFINAEHLNMCGGTVNDPMIASLTVGRLTNGIDFFRGKRKIPDDRFKQEQERCNLCFQEFSEQKTEILEQ